MKTVLFVLLFLLLKVQCVYAQKFSIGLNGGFTKSYLKLIGPTIQNPYFQIDYSITQDYPDVYTPNFGIFGLYTPSNRFAFLIDMNYQQMKVGYRENFILASTFFGLPHEDSVENVITSNYKYIRLDLLPRYYLNKGKIKSFVQAGPYLNFLLSAKSVGLREYYNINYGPNTYFVNQTLKLENTRQLLFGIQAGLGFEVGRFGLTYLYSYGLSDLQVPLEKLVEKWGYDFYLPDNYGNYGNYNLNCRNHVVKLNITLFRI